MCSLNVFFCFVLCVEYVLVSVLNAGVMVLLGSLSLDGVLGVLDPVFECGVFIWFLLVYFLI